MVSWARPTTWPRTVTRIDAFSIATAVVVLKITPMVRLPLVYPAILSGRALLPACDPKHPVSFIAVPRSAEGGGDTWPFGLSKEPYDVNRSGLFRAFGGVAGGETDGAVGMLEGQPVQHTFDLSPGRTHRL